MTLHRPSSKTPNPAKPRKKHEAPKLTSGGPDGIEPDQIEVEAPSRTEQYRAAAEAIERESLNLRGGVPDTGHLLLQGILLVGYQLAGIRDDIEILREIEEDRAEDEGI